MVPEGRAPPTTWGLGLVVVVAAAAAFLVLSRDDAERGGLPAPAPAPAPAPEPPTARGLPVLDVEPVEVPEDDEASRATRARHVEHYIQGRGVQDDVVLDAMIAVPRHAFVPEGMREHAYDDAPLPIGEDQTISQPFIVASMTEEAQVRPGDKVLEIGTGSGYQAAVLAAITEHVYSIEIKEKLARRAAATLQGAGYATVRVAHADGYYGWAAEAPFDAILVTAAAPHVPPPLVEQLARGGRMVIPVGSPFAIQDLVLVTKDEEGNVRTQSLYPVRFVPLTGSLGETED